MRRFGLAGGNACPTEQSLRSGSQLPLFLFFYVLIRYVLLSGAGVSAGMEGTLPRKLPEWTGESACPTNGKLAQAIGVV